VIDWHASIAFQELTICQIYGGAVAQSTGKQLPLSQNGTLAVLRNDLNIADPGHRQQ